MGGKWTKCPEGRLGGRGVEPLSGRWKEWPENPACASWAIESRPFRPFGSGLELVPGRCAGNWTRLRWKLRRAGEASRRATAAGGWDSQMGYGKAGRFGRNPCYAQKLPSSPRLRRTGRRAGKAQDSQNAAGRFHTKARRHEKETGLSVRKGDSVGNRRNPASPRLRRAGQTNRTDLTYRMAKSGRLVGSCAGNWIKCV